MRRTCSALLGVAVVCLVATVAPALAAVEPPAESPIAGDHVRFRSADGVELGGYFFKAVGAPRGNILFVHEPFRSQRDWAYLAEKMSKKGFATLIFDLRGHGESLRRNGEELDREIFGAEEYQAMTKDVDAALVQLAKAAPGAEHTHVIGADLGGSLALLAAVPRPEISSVALISPGLGYDDVSIVGRAGELGRPLLLVYSVEDGYSRKSAEVLEKEAKGPLHTEVYYGVGHGTKMLAREPALEAFLQSWFLGTVITPEGRALADTGKPVAGEKEVVGGIDAEAEKKKSLEQRNVVNAGTVKEDEEESGRKLGTARD